MTSLKLIALEPDDVPFVSAQLQDAVVKLADAAYDARARRFAFLCNRYDWLAGADGGTPGPRKRAAVRIEQVTRLQVHGFDPKDRSSVLDVLALVFDPHPDAANAPAGTLTIACAGGATLKLDVECLEIAIQDLGPAWLARAVPDHSSPGDSVERER